MVREQKEQWVEWDGVPTFHDRVEKGTVCRYAAPDHLQKPYLAIQFVARLEEGKEKEGEANARCFGSFEG